MICKNTLTLVLTEEQISLRIAEANSNLHHYKCRIDNLWKRTASLQDIYPKLDDTDLDEYIDTEAILYYKELQDCGVSFPAWQDMITVGGETDLRLFLKIGRNCYDDIIKYLPKTKNTQRILDFGVGCARTARHFYQKTPQYEVHGCDVDVTPIEYISNNIPFIQPLVSNNEPPLPYESDYFDVIYSVSVFSHLKEKSFYDWAKELSRILKKGGLLIITIHGLHALNITRNKESVSSIGITEKAFENAESLIEKDGFIWMPQETTSLDIDTTQYGISFVDKNKLAEYLPSSLKVIHYGEGEIGGWQDMVVLQKI